MAEGCLDEEQVAAQILVLLKKNSEARLLDQHQRMSNLAQRQQMFYSRHASWGSNIWTHFPSPLYDVSPMPPSYQFPQLPSRADLVYAQRPMFYGMPFSPHYGNSYVSTPQSNAREESRVSRTSPTNTSPSLASLCLQDNDKQTIRQTRTCSSDGHKAANRRKRRNFSDEQKKILESFYLSDQNPLFEDRLQLEKLTKLSEDRIHIWFQNRRAKDRRKQHMAQIFKQSQVKQLSVLADSSTVEDGMTTTEQMAEQRLNQYEDCEPQTNESQVDSEGLESEGMGSSDDENSFNKERKKENEHAAPNGTNESSNTKCSAYHGARAIQTKQSFDLQQPERSYRSLHCFQMPDTPRSYSKHEIQDLSKDDTFHVRSPLVSSSQGPQSNQQPLPYLLYFQRVLLPEAAAQHLTGLSFTLMPEIKRTLPSSSATCVGPVKSNKDANTTSNQSHTY